ncbi:LysR family transcriptional regulator [Paenibacillus turpanensis]|uniref:LysR family transcriptional regulator n=1 Tax=Paenibacillus turpanensis TaxID=2689078 RepID=UPI00140E432B|nr:LysR family transcriptional regulator [Paenibacillus turpanensis]
MNLQQLKVFATAARSKTLSEAAEALELRQPTVSFHLKKLEEELGIELLRKQGRHVTLTDAGGALVPYARRIAALQEEASELMKEYREQGRGKLRIGASYTPATYFLPHYMGRFQQQFPGAVPLLTVKKAAGILDLLMEYEIDAAVVSLRNEPIEGLEVISLVEDELMLIVPPDHRLAQLEPLTIEDLQTEPFLVHEQGSTSRELSDKWAREAGLRWEIRMELGAIETIKESIKYKMGIGILPRRSVQRETELGELVMRELPGYVNERHICLVYRKEDILAAPVRNFISYLQAIVQAERLEQTK